MDIAPGLSSHPQLLVSHHQGFLSFLILYRRRPPPFILYDKNVDQISDRRFVRGHCSLPGKTCENIYRVELVGFIDACKPHPLLCM